MYSLVFNIIYLIISLDQDVSPSAILTFWTGSIPGLYLLDASSPPPHPQIVTTQDVSMVCQMSPGVQILPSIEPLARAVFNN